MFELPQLNTMSNYLYFICNNIRIKFYVNVNNVGVLIKQYMFIIRVFLIIDVSLIQPVCD